jgi:hypothetical protein
LLQPPCWQALMTMLLMMLMMVLMMIEVVS